MFDNKVSCAKVQDTCLESFSNELENIVLRFACVQSNLSTQYNIF